MRPHVSESPERPGVPPFTPHVRAYAENLVTQIQDIKSAHHAKSLEELLLKKDTLPSDVFTRIAKLVDELHAVMKHRELPQEIRERMRKMFEAALETGSHIAIIATRIDVQSDIELQATRIGVDLGARILSQEWNKAITQLHGDNLKEKGEGHLAIARAQIKREQDPKKSIVRAIKYKDAIANSWDIFDMYIALAKVFFDCGDKPAAKENLTVAKDLFLETFAAILPSVRKAMFRSLIKAFGYLGMYDETVNILSTDTLTDEEKASLAMPDNRILDTLVNEALERKNFADARRIIDSIADMKQKGESLFYLGKAYLKEGNIDQAGKCSQELRGDEYGPFFGFNEEDLEAMIALEKIKRHMDATQELRRAEKPLHMSLGKQDYLDKIRSLLGQCFAFQGSIPHANELIKDISEPSERFLAQAKIIGIQARTDVDVSKGAESLIQNITKKVTYDYTIGEILAEIVHAGYGSLAIRSLKDEVSGMDQHNFESILLDVIRAFGELKDFQSANICLAMYSDGPSYSKDESYKVLATYQARAAFDVLTQPSIS